MALLNRINARRSVKLFYRTTTKLDQDTQPEQKSNPDLIGAWQIPNYGKLEKLKFNYVKKPIIKKPKEIIVKVSAASVNPLDVDMLGGYGNVLLDLMRKLDLNCEKMNFPLQLGRDFSGEIVEKGNDVRNDLKIGDKVYGVIPPHFQGCHAEMVVAEDGLVAHKPDHLTDEEAAGIMYAGMTAWSALKITGDLGLLPAKGQNTLVIGGAGGVGSLAIQLLKVWGAEVSTTCRKDAIPIVEKLKPDRIIDYTEPHWFKELERGKKFDLILDASGNVSPPVFIPLLNNWRNAKFITLKSPVLKNTDKLGLLGGMVQNATELFMSNITSGAVTKGTTVRWGYFLPISFGITEISQLVNTKQIKPLVDKVLPFSQMPAAFERVAQGHLRGKVIVSMSK